MRCVSKPFQGQKQATALREYRSTNARQIVLQTQKTTVKTSKKTNLDFLNTLKLDDCLRKLLTKFPKRDDFHGLLEKNEKKCCRYHCRLHLTNDQDQQEGKMWSSVQDLHRKDSSQPA